MSIQIYAYSHGVFSSRQIEKRCRQDLAFLYIAGMNCPNFRVLSDFRKDHGEFFRTCFKQTVQLAMALGMVSLGHVSLDGSKFKANSSKHKAMSYGRLKEQEQELCEEIEALTAQADRCDEEEDQAYQERTGYELPEDLRDKKKRLKKVREMKRTLEAREEELRPGQEIEDKKQISFADPEARIMKKKGDFEYAYNAQISVDGKSQVIVGQHVSQAANDSREVSPALYEVEEATGRLPEKLSLDNGYYSGNNLQEVSDRQVEAYIATDRGREAGEGRPGREPAPPGEGGLSLRRGAGRLSQSRRADAEVEDGPSHGTSGVSRRHRGVPELCLLSSLLPVEVGGGAHDHERREGAVAAGDERADVATGSPSDLRAAQDDRGAGVRADQELGIPGIRAAGEGEGGGGVLAGLRGAQPQENHFCNTSGRGVSGVREASGLGVKKGRIREKEVKNRPLSALVEAKIEQKIRFQRL